MSPCLAPGQGQRRRWSAGQEALEGRVVRAAGRAELAPGAVLWILVVAEPDEARPMAEAVALHLVEPDFRDELRFQSCLLELSRPPAVRLRETTVRLLVDQRHHALGDLRVPRCCNGRRSHVVEPAVVAIETEEQSCDAVRLRLPAEPDDPGGGRL